MTITTSPPPAHSTPVALARGFLTGGVVGTSVAAYVVGCVIESVPLCVMGVGLPGVYGLLFFLAGVPRRAREAAVAPRTALAMIESLHAIGGEATSDVSVRFDLTVAPDDVPAYRVEITQDINLAYLSDYRPRRIVVVQYPPDRPWRVRIVKWPTPEWEDRAAGARLDSAPGPAMVSEPPKSCAVGFVALLGLLLGAAGVILLFRADLFDQDATARPPSSAQPSVSATSSTTVVSSASGTVALGPGQSFLDKGEVTLRIAGLWVPEEARDRMTAGHRRAADADCDTFRLVDALIFDYKDLHVRVDRGVFELFPLNSIETALRVPLRWLGVLVHFKKPNRPGELIFGVVRDPSAALYGTDRLAFRYRYTQAVGVPHGDEPLFRAYFTEVAALTDRRVV